jgi:glycosyltransferase involved in cell wall biosynthesis
VIVRGDSNDMKPRPLWVRWCHRALLAQFDAFMAVGLANRAFYLRNGVREASIFSAPHFVDNARFRAQCEAERLRRAELRAGWSVPEDAVCFSFIGKIESKKNLPGLIAAMARAAAQGSRVHLLVVGSGEQLPRSRDVATRLQAPVTFAGFLNQTQLGAAYAVTDCLVLPSDYGETWGLVVNEAMACGIPALVSDRVGCGPDLVEEGRTGGRFAFGDVAAMAVAIRSLASQPGRLREMGARAIDRIAGYSVERAVQGTLEAVDFAVAARRDRR